MRSGADKLPLHQLLLLVAVPVRAKLPQIIIAMLSRVTPGGCWRKNSGHENTRKGFKILWCVLLVDKEYQRELINIYLQDRGQQMANESLGYRVLRHFECIASCRMEFDAPPQQAFSVLTTEISNGPLDTSRLSVAEDTVILGNGHC